MRLYLFLVILFLTHTTNTLSQNWDLEQINEIDSIAQVNPKLAIEKIENLD
jgi:hypothetical protein